MLLTFQLTFEVIIKASSLLDSEVTLKEFAETFKNGDPAAWEIYTVST